jgi:outer membrane protein OmpA-like peptidoglycan-associated protein
MNTSYTRSIIAVAVAAALAVGCASAPTRPAGSEAVRAKLVALQNDAALASQAPIATKDAEAAVERAEIVQPNVELAAHRVYIADRKVDIAKAQAETKLAEKERTALNEQSEKARLDARTREVDQARSDALMARAENAEQKMAATQARSDAETSRLAADASQLAAAASQQQASELQRQLEILQAKPTDRGLVLTLGDTLFATGRSDLKSGATANLDRLGEFLTEYPSRTASIEGYTDSMGSEDSNQSLSERRADSVKRYLIGRGIGSNRLSSMGRGENAPVADNDSLAGRQQNRRVEVIISEATAAEGTAK